PRALEKLNAIIHPNLLKILKSEIKRAKIKKKYSLIVVDAALIYEWCIEDWFDRILVITSIRGTRIKRLIDSGLTRKEAVSRIGSQIPQRKKAAMADYVIINDGGRSQLKRKIKRFLKSLENGE
ncbi:MAG: dephospho-CoA kinase, partial [candidate division Zixibacteria bacterium]